jgi:hypothetical protein
MAGVWVIAEHRNGDFRKVTLEAQRGQGRGR